MSLTALKKKVWCLFASQSFTAREKKINQLINWFYLLCFREELCSDVKSGRGPAALLAPD